MKPPISAYDIAELLDPPRTPQAVYNVIERLKLEPALTTARGHNYFASDVVPAIQEAMRSPNGASHGQGVVE